MVRDGKVHFAAGRAPVVDDNFFHRSYWAYATRVARYTTGTQAASGYLVTLDDTTAYAYGRDRER